MEEMGIAMNGCSCVFFLFVVNGHPLVVLFLSLIRVKLNIFSHLSNLPCLLALAIPPSTPTIGCSNVISSLLQWYLRGVSVLKK